MNVFIYIATLGPGGTDSERAARYFGSGLKASYGISLEPSFEAALQNVRTGEASFGIVPAAYNNLFRLHSDFRDLVIAEAFPLPTKEMVLARRPGSTDIKRVALHRSTDALCPANTEKLYIPSKPLCIEAVVRGDADAAIGSRDVVENYGLEIIESFGEIPMSWEVFARR